MKSVAILGLKVPVKKQKDFADVEGNLGLYCPIKRTITLDADLKGVEKTEVLIHEMVHALFHRGGLFDAQLPGEVEEIIATQVAILITENFRLQRK